MQNTTPARKSDDEIRRLAAVVDQIEDTVVITDRRGVIEYINPAMARRSGYSEEEAIGSKPSVQKSGEHPPEFYKGLWETILDGRTFRADFVNRNKDGSLRHEEKTISPIRDDDGEITHFAATGRDVTDRRRAEQALEDANRALEQRVEDRTAELRAARADAERASHEKSTFLSGLNHALRSPINATMGYAQLLDMDASLTEKQRRYVDQLMAGSAQLRDLLADAFDFTRAEAAQLTLSLIHVDIRDVASQAVDACDDASVAMVPCAELAAPVLADAVRARQVVDTLVACARARRHEGGGVQVHIDTRVDGQVGVRVAYDGPGLSGEQADALPQPFSRAASKALGSESLGTDLAIGRHVMDQMGGSLTVGSGETTTFCAHFQTVTRDSPDERTAEGRVVLCIVDGADMDLLRDVLSLRPDFTTQRVENVDEADAALDAGRVALVVADLDRYPHVCAGVTARLSRQEGGDRVGVVGIADPSVSAGPLPAGVDALTSRPIDVDKLLDAVDTLTVTAGAGVAT
ncbi:PAS domain-containing sensor histidine kinase [Candidatus Poribacteria bacterium]|jgi:two-component system, sensor histidine kinase and response regulator|nr:PAS domain-containing sensor histidine kinase [Candidatus Poribacteria bacterium]MBT5532096.1 PAS domain-containing sensor histidine kinase [Candidatus Poribacteria bacterium]MBT7100794.1 PAS domain-containing sensor histidine kinase [Candidatus Poribacteria bacterium]MBT7805129.1 PAS domain-containing sensor histidine kinase [Candidatus Poribacteria bacterium]